MECEIWFTAGDLRGEAGWVDGEGGRRVRAVGVVLGLDVIRGDHDGLLAEIGHHMVGDYVAPRHEGAGGGSLLHAFRIRGGFLHVRYVVSVVGVEVEVLSWEHLGLVL